MGGANDAGFRVMKQHRLAIGRKNPQDHARSRGHHGIGFGRSGERSG